MPVQGYRHYANEVRISTALKSSKSMSVSSPSLNDSHAIIAALGKHIYADEPHIPKVDYNDGSSEHLDSLSEATTVGQAMPSRSPRPQSVVSCYGEVDWLPTPRSASPSAASTHSGNSINSSSSHSEVGDSGVSSDHDTPPPVTRYPRPRRHIASSDSDSESNVSSDSLGETPLYRSTRQWSPVRPSSGGRESLSPPSEFRNTISPPSGGRKSISPPSGGRESISPPSGGRESTSPPSGRLHKLQSQTKPHNKKIIPDALLKEIKYKWEEIEDRRRRQRALGGVCTTVADRGHIRVSSSWSSIPLKTPQPSSTTPSSPTLSRTSSSNFPSTLSLFGEDESEMLRTSSMTVESWRRAGQESEKSLYECRDNQASSGFSGIRDIFSPQQESTIKSYKGTVRGVKNRVRAGIATFTHEHRLLKHLQDRERGKVVVYVTTLGIVRSTYERCLRIRKILWTLLVRFDERDVFMARDTQIQLMDRTHKRCVTVPHVFLEGQYLGDAEQIEMMNESGELRRLLAPYRTESVTTSCNTCGGFRLLPCSVCRGSKKSVHRNDFTLEFVALKCSSCDESGLVKCEDCDPFKDLDKTIEQ